ncbi:MAG: hypothetical protein K0S33_2497 [Bacteroidetes bacterium]|jgi:hypothetical protein|nr:hypothetical protein [Bacteroidota bacterium]
MEVTGILKLKYDVQQVSDKFKKRDFVMTVEPTSPYPQHVTFQLTQDKVSLVDNFNVGEEMKVSFNLRGREWNSPQGETKYFNTIDAWRIEKMTAGSNNNASSNNASTSMPQNNTASPVFNSSAADDDLPF